MVKVVSSRYTEEKCKMKKPYIICHMMTSVDGRIDCAMTSKLSGVSDYYTTLAQINVPTTVSGRVTAELEMAEPGKFAVSNTEIYGQCELEMISGGCDKETHIRRFRTKLISMGMCGYDRVIVEPSGIFDVDEFFDVLHEEPLDNWYEIGNVIAVVDAELENELSAEADYLLASEAANAGKILLSHADEADGVQIEQTIAHLNRAMAQIGCKRRFDMEIVKKGTIQLTNSDLESFSLCGYVYENYQKMDLSEQNGFQSLYFMNSTMSEETLKAAVKKLFEDENCGNIFRIKGFLKADNDKWLELNATHSKITLQPIAEGQDVLIVIGERLNKEAVESYIQSDSFRM